MNKIAILLVSLLSLTFAEKGMKVYLATGDSTVVALSQIDSITFVDLATDLTEKSLTLYNPYAADGFNSAYDLVNMVPVAGEVDAISGKMVYAAVDSLVADIALDNSLDIRATTTVTELTSINGGMFAVATDDDYATATDLSLVALAATKTFTDNEAIEFTTGDVYILKLANNRGYAILKIGAIDHNDTAGSVGNTGSIALTYKVYAM